MLGLRNFMDSEPTDETNDTNSQSGTSEKPASKLRDLRPEKDPMGAGIETEPPRNVAPPRKLP